MVLQFRDDGFMTGREISFQERGSLQWERLYARWELENDSLTVAPVRDEDGLSSPSFTVMIAFEDEALILLDSDSDDRVTFQPGGIPPGGQCFARDGHVFRRTLLRDNRRGV